MADATGGAKRAPGVESKRVLLSCSRGTSAQAGRREQRGVAAAAAAAYTAAQEEEEEEEEENVDVDVDVDVNVDVDVDVNVNGDDNSLRTSDPRRTDHQLSMHWFLSTLVGTALTSIALSQDILPFPTSCANVAASRYSNTVDSAWEITKIASGLRQPRTVIFDPLGNMLVLQASSGVSVHTFGPDGCINSTEIIVQNAQLNHGLDLTPDGKTLYVSAVARVWSYTYDAAARSATNQKVIVTGMSTSGHSTRTVAISPKNPNIILVSTGSNANWDYSSGNPSTGRACVKTFDVTKAPENGYDYNSEGTMLAYGVRNEVAIAWDPNAHAWGVENSGDDFRRTVDGQATDVHIDNPAEELNYLGDPESPRTPNWFGYPTCFTVWEPSLFKDTTALKTGSQFVVTPNTTFNDASCVGVSNPPRLSFPAHMAPIGSVFDKNATNLYVTFHGSWNRQPAQGYFVAEIPFTKTEEGLYEPVAAPDSQEGYKTVIGAQNPGSCSGTSCWRPSGISWDKVGEKLFVSSDNEADGEIFVLRRK
ncbi:soluble quino protein glucose dehydrogenase [Astrocystis sublimbata]|nr:soluble quino protein glucose dehydrogenase [Astrocystis sublimbata]